MRSKEKLGTHRGVSAWKALETAGDCKRFFRWLILSIRDQTIDPKTAAIMGHIGSFLLKTVEVNDLEQRLAAIEAALREPDAASNHNAHTPH